MTEVTFETATLAAAISKAARVAPNKGAAFDKSAGIVIEVRPSALEKQITVKATDMEVTYLEWVNSLSISGDEVDWRLPSGTLAGIVAGLPLGSQTTIKSIEDKDLVSLTCGKTKAKLPVITGLPFADFEPFDGSDLTVVPNFSERVAQVSWACDRSAIPFTGVHIDGTMLTATDRYRLAQVPCEAGIISDPITVPLEVLRPILKHLTDAKLKATDRRLLIMPDEYTQVTTVIFDAKYPNIEKVQRRDYPNVLMLDKEAVRTVINRMLVLVKGERYPVMKLTIGKGAIGVFMNVEDVGEMEDEIEAPDATHEPFEVYYTPTNFLDGLVNSGKPEVEFRYDPANAMSFAYFKDEGYESWIVPRKNMNE